MRTTLDLDDELLRATKRLAAERGTTLTALLEEALRLLLANRSRRKPPFRLRLLIKKGTALPGFDLADRDSLYERMEGRG
jgi:hypothetical protein